MYRDPKDHRSRLLFYFLYSMKKNGIFTDTRFHNLLSKEGWKLETFLLKMYLGIYILVRVTLSVIRTINKIVFFFFLSKEINNEKEDTRVYPSAILFYSKISVHCSL